MAPTPQLRFVERVIEMPVQGDFAFTYKTVRILQQWWEKKIWAHDDWIVADSERRDVPIEKE